MIDVSHALEMHAIPGGITIIRREPGGYVDGRAVPGAEVETEGIEAAVLPAATEDIELLPEGMRSKESKAIWTHFALRTGHANGSLPDRVEVQGVTYEVHAMRDFRAMAGCTKAIGVRVSS